MEGGEEERGNEKGRKSDVALFIIEYTASRLKET